MNWIPRALRRLRLLFRHDAVERSMADEMRHHIECEVADLVRQGLPPDEARRTALLRFGGVERFKEEARDARGGRLVDDFLRDLRYAARVLRRAPGFTAAAILTLALGLGAAAAIFSIVHGVVLRPLPYADPDRLVAVWERNVPRNRDRNVVSVDAFEAWSEGADAFSGMAALVPFTATLASDTAPERLSGAEVSPGYFSLLGVTPLYGRDFARADARAGSSPVVILSHALWERRFGSDPAVVGRTLPLVGRPHTIVGVMPRQFEAPAFGWLGAQELWVPFAVTAQNRAWGRFLLIVARLRPDVSVTAAHAELQALARRRAEQDPALKNWATTVGPLADEITGEVRVSLYVLLGAVTLLLMMSVANVATLTLSWMRRRRHELAVRRSLGATDARLFRQLLVQGATIGITGCLAGIAAAFPLTALLLAWLPPDVPRGASIGVDRPVLIAAAITASVITVLFAMFTAGRGRRNARATPLARDPGINRVAARTGTGVLVASEIAFGVALSVVALLMVRTFVELRSVDLGFAPDHVVAARIGLPGDRYASDEAQVAFFGELLDRVRPLPGVESAGIISTRPLGGLGPATGIRDPAAPPPADGSLPAADVRYADPEVFRVLRIPLVRGRSFPLHARSDAPPPVVISEAAAGSLWPGEDPIGRRIHVELFGGLTGEVVGVAGDVHLLDPRTPPRPAIYLQATRFSDGTRDVLLRVSGDTASAVSALRQIVTELDPALPLYQVTTMTRLADSAVARDRFTALVLSAFAAIALTLAAIGIFGVFSGEIAHRRKELGIRLAMGATPRRLLGMMLTRAISGAAVGVAIGMAIAFALTRLMASILFAVEPDDPATYASVGLVLLALAAIATAVPVLRALRASPLEALREG